MEMPMPDNTLPMMTGFGQFGPIEMGGMFSVVKVREDLARDDYKDPGWYRHPAGTVAHQVNGPAPEAPSRKGATTPTRDEIEVTVVKPRMNSHNGQH
jgi:manganese oxidase